MNSKKNSTNKVKKKFRPFYNFVYDFVKLTGAPPMFIWLRPKVYYPSGRIKKSGAMLISANHKGFLDPIVVHLVFPFRHLNYLATKDLFNTKLKEFFFNQMHCIVVDKENFSISSFHDVVERLESGKAVVIFPEGGINQEAGNDILAFKSGAVLMAHKARAPILPMYIVKRDKWYQRQKIVVGQPVDIYEMLGKMPTMQDMNNTSEFLRNKENELKEYYENLLGAKNKRVKTEYKKCGKVDAES